MVVRLTMKKEYNLHTHTPSVCFHTPFDELHACYYTRWWSWWSLAHIRSARTGHVAGVACKNADMAQMGCTFCTGLKFLKIKALDLIDTCHQWSGSLVTCPLSTDTWA